MNDYNRMIFTVGLLTGWFLVSDPGCLNFDLPFTIVSLWGSCVILLSVRIKWNDNSDFLIVLGGLNEVGPKPLTEYLVTLACYYVIII